MTDQTGIPPDDSPPITEPELISSGPMTIALASIRNAEAYLRWQGAQWSIALNLTGLVAIMYRLISTPKQSEIFVLSVCCAAAAGLSLEWYAVLRRDGRLLNFWNAKLAEHERRNGIKGGMRLFTAVAYQNLTASRGRLQRRLERMTVIFIAVWVVVAIVLLTLAINSVLKGGVQ